MPGDLMRVDGPTVQLSRRLREAGRKWVAGAIGGPERGQRAITFVLEVARLVAPEARRRAQARLAALSPAEQEGALQAQSLEGPLPESVGKLLALVARGQA